MSRTVKTNEVESFVENKTKPEKEEKQTVGLKLNPSVKVGIIRYLQLYPFTNKTVEKVLIKMYAKKSYTETEWKEIINEFINS